METITIPPMYENGSLSQVTGGLLRPGGVDLTERMLELCELFPGDMALDVGCGAGGTVRHLLDDFSVYPIGFDQSTLLLRDGLENDPRLPLVCARGASLPVMGGHADAILAECSLSAMSNFESTLMEFHRVLRKGGRLAVTDVYARRPEGIPALRVLPLTSGIRNAISKDEMMSHLQVSGFEIIIWEDHSDSLKTLAKQMVCCHGSTNGFWSVSEPAVDLMDVQIALSKAKLGYYLLVARKV